MNSKIEIAREDRLLPSNTTRYIGVHVQIYSSEIKKLINESGAAEKIDVYVEIDGRGIKFKLEEFQKLLGLDPETHQSFMDKGLGDRPQYKKK